MTAQLTADPPRAVRVGRHVAAATALTSCRPSPGFAVAPAATDSPSGPVFVCTRCFGPLEAIYDLDGRPRHA